MTGRIPALLLVLCLACEPAPVLPLDAGRADAPALDAGRADAGPPRMGASGYPASVPFALARTPLGDPIGAAERTALTDDYLELLEAARWFEVLEERVHGIPEDDAAGRMSYGTWWSGVRVVRAGSTVRYVHSADGADNNGLRTAPLLEAACFAQALSPSPRREALVRRLVRGFHQWILASDSTSHPEIRGVMTRAMYPAPTTTTIRGLTLEIDTSLSRPGVDNGATAYVHVPDHPIWGDVYFKNKRSKDDVGDMLRALAELASCRDALSTDAQAEIDATWDAYFAWAHSIVADGYRIASVEPSFEIVRPSESLAIYFVSGMGIECTGAMALFLAGEGRLDGFSCGTDPPPRSGIGPLDWTAEDTGMNGSAQILRSHHEAALAQALLANDAALAEELAGGLGMRIDRAIGAFVAGTPPDRYPAGDFARLVLHAAALGVPLRGDEVRWLGGELRASRDAHVARAASDPGDYDSFAASLADGEYAFEPGGGPIAFPDLGLPLATCGARWRATTGESLLDCAAVEAWLAARPL